MCMVVPTSPKESTVIDQQSDVNSCCVQFFACDAFYEKQKTLKVSLSLFSTYAPVCLVVSFVNHSLSCMNSA